MTKLTAGNSETTTELIPYFGVPEVYTKLYAELNFLHDYVPKLYKTSHYTSTGIEVDYVVQGWAYRWIKFEEYTTVYAPETAENVDGVSHMLRDTMGVLYDTEDKFIYHLFGYDSIEEALEQEHVRVLLDCFHDVFAFEKYTREFRKTLNISFETMAEEHPHLFGTVVQVSTIIELLDVHRYDLNVDFTEILSHVFMKYAYTLLNETFGIENVKDMPMDWVFPALHEDLGQQISGHIVQFLKEEIPMQEDLQFWTSLVYAG